MAWFRGRGKGSDGQDLAEPGGDAAAAHRTDGTSTGDAGSAAEDDAGAAESRAEAARLALARERESERARRGPLDSSEATPAAAEIDLGALRLPARRDMELRLEVQEKSRVMSVTVAMAGSTLQLQAFAAPRTAGVWDDIRTEIGAQVTKQGGSAEEADGAFGRELIARLPARTADGRTGHQASRFVGVDGPRWFLRGVFGGPAVHDPAAAEPLEQLMRGCVVVRGTDARPPRELLPLKLPPTAQQQPAPPATAPAPTPPAPVTAEPAAPEVREPS